MNKRQAKKYKIKNVVDRMVNATTNSTVEEHKSGKISNTRRIKYHTTAARKNKLNRKITRKIKLNKKITKPAPQDKPVETTETPLDFGTRKVIVKSHRTKEQWLTEARVNFINRFMDRIKERFPDISEEKYNFIKDWLFAHDQKEIDNVLKLLDEEFRDVYYESAEKYRYEGRDMSEYIDEFIEMIEQFNIDELLAG